MRWRVVTLPKLEQPALDLELHCDTDDPETIQRVEEAASRAGMWIERITPSEDWSKLNHPTTDERNQT